jgi:hypothetical protein
MLAIFGRNKKKIQADYKFSEAENTACFVCDHVFNRERPVLYAAHEKEDGSWQFLCGQVDHAEGNIKIISLREATEIDFTINDLCELPLGVGAERRNTEDQWTSFLLQDL